MAEQAPAKNTPDTEAVPAPGGPVDDLVSTQHVLTIGRRKLRYTATAGRVVLRQEVLTEGKFDGHLPRAEVFLTAYTLDGADAGRRPVTFAFNGGPGSSSIWLHLGLLGPRRVVSGDAGELAPPPYGLVDNAETLLQHSDLVFIDPVATGYSRAVEGEKPGEYHGFTRDLESVGEVIRLWTSRNGRWMSPKFLAGESYGTTRAAGLAAHLQDRHGMYLNGVMLISAVLEFGTLDFTPGNDVPFALFLPSYAAVAHYHGLLGDRELTDVLADAERYAAGRYPYALAQGNRLPADERTEAITRLAGLTGLSPDYLDRVNLRIEHTRFFAELLRSRRQVVGRLDGRFTGWDADAAGEQSVDDPSFRAITGPYTAALNHYVRAELEYLNDLPYEVLNSQAAKDWSFKEFENNHVTVADKLAEAMRANPYLKVHVASGHYDCATPYYATEHTLARLQLPDDLRPNIEVRYYPAGHMMYVHEPSRVQQSEDLAAFVQAASNR
ncbi:peptidase S10 serine carboxypeptidase [Kribbella flavida DSM 17836]|uniref:Peptidase S10 serine carboxypeptidase n=1 Tax=Kribbella flavida (strain DSM 17836 / JCM 10339 / NBRC 14399) TaxID=479435 RepID=D2PXN0_KRIFD|nr:peptidase S10 [Kribbella flavida]ADB31672.1 peptidase S10 serine carboxypeptidase [Kribbella flavida DSM 17836]